MNILFIIDPIEKLTIEYDSTFFVMVEALQRGHSCFVTHSEELSADTKGIYTYARRITDATHAKKRWETEPAAKKYLKSMKIIYMRKDPPWNLDYVLMTQLLSYAQSEKTHVINDPAALRGFNEKLGILQFSKYIPDTVVTKQRNEILMFLKKHGTIVLKPLDLSSGQEVLVVDKKDKNKNALIELLTHKGSRLIMAQRYIPEVTKGDKRVFLLDGKIAGHYIRFPGPGEHRSNLHAGGSAHPTTLTAKEKRTCTDIARGLQKMGILFAGLDMIHGLVTEINITSPGGGFAEVNQRLKRPIEAQIVDLFEKLANE